MITNSASAIENNILRNLHLNLGRVPKTATLNDWYMALAFTIRDQILEKWIPTIEYYIHSKEKSISNFSVEFLTGPLLENNIINLGVREQVKTALHKLGLDYEKLIEQEPEPGLGNGGLGRLAVCFLDSLASLNILSVGYGIRYEFGLFKQAIQDGWQIELTDNWLYLGNPWEIIHPEISFPVHFGGYVENKKWIPNLTVKGVACDTPIVGYKSDIVNLLRLWKAEAVESFNYQAFNAGEYWRAVGEKVSSETISKVLYPNDEPLVGKRLRLQQQYFFVSCSLQDLIRVSKLRGGKLEDFHLQNAIQLNDTHPAIAIPELMRLLIDIHGIDWETAWDITQKTFAYTNHTLLREALEKWNLHLFQEHFPRHLEIIFEINERFLNKIRSNAISDSKIQKLSIIEEESGIKHVVMAHLATIGSHKVNGVSSLHTALLKSKVLNEFYDLEPEKFINITNGVTPRRWILLSNPKLAELMTGKIGTEWILNMESHIHKIEAFIDDLAFRDAWQQIKYDNKQRLASAIFEKTGIKINPSSLFDIQVKRIHEYKRQHLNILNVIAKYLQIINRNAMVVPRTVIFGGKASPGYAMAKLIIKLINNVAKVINNDPKASDLLKVVFFPDFNVKQAHFIYPAADLSEQISTAGKEASGTGNMKFAMNGALTIGTLDGANIEIREAVGEDNFFLFGLKANEVHELRKQGYNPLNFLESNPELKEVIDLVYKGHFSPDEPHLFRPLIDSLVHHDEYMLFADFASYQACQERVDDAYRNQDEWVRKSIYNVARIGYFSSDRSIREYAKNIWNVSPVRIN